MSVAASRGDWPKRTQDQAYSDQNQNRTFRISKVPGAKPDISHFEVLGEPVSTPNRVHSTALQQCCWRLS